MCCVEEISGDDAGWELADFGRTITPHITYNFTIQIHFGSGLLARLRRPGENIPPRLFTIFWHFRLSLAITIRIWEKEGDIILRKRSISYSFHWTYTKSFFNSFLLSNTNAANGSATAYLLLIIRKCVYHLGISLSVVAHAAATRPGSSAGVCVCVCRSVQATLGGCCVCAVAGARLSTRRPGSRHWHRRPRPHLKPNIIIHIYTIIKYKFTVNCNGQGPPTANWNKSSYQKYNLQ